MNTLSVNSVNSNYVRTAVAQQRVSVDRANVRETETRLEEYKAQLVEDLTYLGKLQRKDLDIQQLQGAQAQMPTLERIERNARSAQQAAAALASMSDAEPTVGSNINIVA